VRVVADLEALSRAAAEEFARRARAAIARQGRFRVALAGGSTPARLYRLLADPRRPWRRRIPWAKVHVFFGDERAVPPSHRDSNYGMARAALLSRVPIPASQVHPIRIAADARDHGRDDGRGKHRGAAALRAARCAARDYERILRRAFETPAGRVPRFDLVLLGMGADGHVASIFPGDPALGVRRRLASGVRPPGPAVPGGTYARVTLNLPILNAAAGVLILVSGDSKRDALAQAVPGRRRAAADRRHLPASRVKPVRGDLLWIVDRAAAGRPRRR
jgi:6-phosphogluconolactonase